MIDTRMCANCANFKTSLYAEPCRSCLVPGDRRNWVPARGAKIAAEEQPAVAEQHEAEEYKGCDNCKFMPLDESEQPCVICRNTIPRTAEKFNAFPFLWQPRDAGDAVNHPAHYNHGEFECIDVMLAVFGKEATQHFCLLNAFKYVWRNGQKSGVEDINKARWYLDKFLELEGDTDEQSDTGTTGA